MWGEGVSGPAEAGPNLVLLPGVGTPVSTLPLPPPWPPWLGLWGCGMSRAVGGAAVCLAFCFVLRMPPNAPLCV